MPILVLHGPAYSEWSTAKLLKSNVKVTGSANLVPLSNHSETSPTRQQTTAASTKVFILKEAETADYPVISPVLNGLIRRVSQELRKYFPTERLSLQPLSGPDRSSCSGIGLFVYTDLEPDEAFNRLKAFDQNWWLDVPVTPETDLLVHVRFNEI